MSDDPSTAVAPTGVPAHDPEVVLHQPDVDPGSELLGVIAAETGAARDPRDDPLDLSEVLLEESARARDGRRLHGIQCANHS